MNKPIKRVVVVGGGTAGWITAGTIAAAHGSGKGRNVKVILIESPNVKTLGVGEGTWPTMRDTLMAMGISERAFISQCDASFKQGSKFVGWQHGASEAYYHPFTLPEGWGETNLARSWFEIRDQMSFANAVCPQGYICEQNQAPKEIATPEYAYVVNYGYHLDAGKFSSLLKEHCCSILGVEYVSADIVRINSDDDGFIRSLQTASESTIDGDLFIDCTGFASLLLGQHYQVPLIDRSDVLFNDSALAIQVPYQDPNGPIASYTQSTAKPHGWIWDIGLQSRKGLGYVYSSRFSSDAEAELELHAYLEKIAPADTVAELEPRKINFTPGYREKSWVKNCVAVGVSAGFLEPLEASALIMIELAAKILAEQLPADFAMMEPLARRYNEKFSYRWERIIDFLKLHYVLSSREDSEYWKANKDPATIPQSLQDLLCLWRYQPPWSYDSLHRDELFPSASFQYVLYGMGFQTEAQQINDNERHKAQLLFDKNIKMTQKLLKGLPENRELIRKVKDNGFRTI